METFEPGASPHDHLLLSYLEGHVRQTVMPGGPCDHAFPLSPTTSDTLLHRHCLASFSPSKAPPVKETGSLEAEDHLVSLGLDGTVEVLGVLVLMEPVTQTWG